MRSLKQTKDRGLVLNPNYGVWKVDVYPDANFLGRMDTIILLILHVLKDVPDLSSRL